MKLKPTIVLDCEVPFDIDVMAAYRQAKEQVIRMNERFAASGYELDVPNEITIFGESILTSNSKNPLIEMPKTYTFPIKVKAVA
jgi:hypothetical protein